ncbi:MAG TPA: PEP-CTERM sorting domain-containing protein [Pyrinomonadaceae bacterium]|nr:PEP-CTERM sorting domain-containing protein [Pyrinomonadaceae bacterium]
MSRTLLLRFTTIIALLAFPATLRADQLGFATFDSGLGAPVIANQVRLVIGFGTDDVGQSLVTVFDVIVDPTDVGRTFSLSSGPEFEAAARFLTDGQNGAIGYFHSFIAGGEGGQVGPESLLFFGDASGSGRVDFAGFEITSLEFRIDELTLSSPGGIWTDSSARSTLTVNGQPSAVPEPATLCLMGLGLAGIYARRRVRAGRGAPPVSGK